MLNHYSARIDLLPKFSSNDPCKTAQSGLSIPLKKHPFDLCRKNTNNTGITQEVQSLKNSQLKKLCLLIDRLLHSESQAITDG